MLGDIQSTGTREYAKPVANNKNLVEHSPRCKDMEVLNPCFELENSCSALKR